MTSLWLAALFRLTAAAPWLVRVAKPLLVRLAWACSPAVRSGTAANGRRLAPKTPPRQFGLSVLCHFYDFVADVGRPPTVDPIIIGDEHYKAARHLGRGAVIVTAHMGSFELGLAALPADETRVHVVFKRDAVPAFERIRRRLRQRMNVTEAAVDGGFAVWCQLREALLRNEVVAVQGDRVLPGQSGHAVKVGAGHLLLPPGPFKLALAADAPVVPIFTARRPDGRTAIHVCPAITVTDVDVAIERYAIHLAAQLESHPTQWLVLQPAFVEDAPPPCPANRSPSPPSPP